MSHALSDVEFLLVTAQASNFVFFLVGVQREFPIIDIHLLEQTWEQNIGVHLLSKLNGAVGHKNLHTLVVEATGLAVIHHEDARHAIESSDAVTDFFTNRNVLHFVKCVHKLNPIHTTATRLAFNPDSRNVVWVALHLFINRFPKRLHGLKIVRGNRNDAFRHPAFLVCRVHVIVHGGKRHGLTPHGVDRTSTVQL